MSDWKNVQYKDGKMRTSEGGGGGASALSDLTDVNLSSPSDGQVLKYDNATDKWVNANESGGGTVTDVTLDGTSVVNGQGVAELETPSADDIEYDNQQSGLSATNVQGAIDELATSGGGGNVDDVEVNGVSVVNAQKVAEITSYKEVTLAEYQALPSSKLSDNVLYCIKDAGGADGFPPLIYSDEEREVGVWRDGKPLYQKTISVASINVGYNAINHNIANLDKAVDMRGRCKFNGANEVVPLPYASLSTNSTILFGNITPTTFAIYTGNGFTSIEDVYVTLQYTKTTDTAGSGTWTTQGEYAHHYSTSEKVIGTWIDGKPLYEKSFHWTGTLNTGTYMSIDGSVNTSNASNFMSETASFKISGYSHITTSVMGKCLDIDLTGDAIVIENFTGHTVTELWVTVRYTKTTD